MVNNLNNEINSQQNLMMNYPNPSSYQNPYQMEMNMQNYGNMGGNNMVYNPMMNNVNNYQPINYGQNYNNYPTNQFMIPNQNYMQNPQNQPQLISYGYPNQNNINNMNNLPIKLNNNNNNNNMYPPFSSNELPLINTPHSMLTDKNNSKRELDKKRAQSSKGRLIIEDKNIYNEQNSHYSRFSSTNQRDQNNSRTAHGYRQNANNYGNDIYKPYTLKEYKQISNQKIVLGSLGPNLGGEEWEKRQEKLRKQEEYSNNIKQTNKAILKPVKEAPQVLIEKQKKEKNETSKVHKANEYAKQVNLKQKNVYNPTNININVNNFNINENNHYNNGTINTSNTVNTNNTNLHSNVQNYLSSNANNANNTSIANNSVQNSNQEAYTSSHAIRQRKGSAKQRYDDNSDQINVNNNINYNYNQSNSNTNNNYSSNYSKLNIDNLKIDNKSAIDKGYEVSDDLRELEKQREQYLLKINEIKDSLLK